MPRGVLATIVGRLGWVTGRGMCVCVCVCCFDFFCPTHTSERADQRKCFFNTTHFSVCSCVSFFLSFHTTNISMVSRSNDKRCSFYDSLPVLDAWYPPQMDKDRKHHSASPLSVQSMPCPETMSSRSSPDGRRCVSFSAEPPSVRYIGSSDEEEQQALFNEIQRKHGGNYRFTGVTRFCSLPRRCCSA